MNQLEWLSVTRTFCAQDKKVMRLRTSVLGTATLQILFLRIDGFIFPLKLLSHVERALNLL